MTRLLVSVRNLREAQASYSAGVSLVDVKEPDHGSLGAADSAIWRAVREVLPASFPVSAALGELVDAPPRLDWSALEGFDYAKVGLSRCRANGGWIDAWRRLLKKIPARVTPVAVAYADFPSAEAPSPEEVLRTGRDLACGVLLLDTFDKSHGGLFDHLSSDIVQSLVEKTHAAGMAVVLAGSLNHGTIEAAAALEPDFVALRGAVCAGGRDKELDASRVRYWVERLKSREPLGCPTNGEPRDSRRVSASQDK